MRGRWKDREKLGLGRVHDRRLLEPGSDVTAGPGNERASKCWKLGQLASETAPLAACVMMEIAAGDSWRSLDAFFFS